jgi:hypothetical protein
VSSSYDPSNASAFPQLDLSYQSGGEAGAAPAPAAAPPQRPAPGALRCAAADLLLRCAGHLSNAGPAWTDIDELNKDNIIACSDYASTIFEHLREAQVRRRSRAPRRHATARSSSCRALAPVHRAPAGPPPAGVPWRWRPLPAGAAGQMIKL